LLTEDDQEENLRVIREAKLATHRVYDFELKKGVDVPDHKTRLAATMLDLAYREGKPVERQISAHGDVSDFPDLLRRLQQSEAAKAIEDSSQKTVTPTSRRSGDELRSSTAPRVSPNICRVTPKAASRGLC